MKYRKTFTYRLTLSTFEALFNAVFVFCHDWFYSLLTQFYYAAWEFTSVLLAVIQFRAATLKYCCLNSQS